MPKKPRMRWVPLVVWAAVIFATSCTHITRDTLVSSMEHMLPEPLGSHFSRFWDHSWFFFVKGYHVAEYTLLTLVCWWVLQIRTTPSYRPLAWSMALSFVYAASDEWHQTFVPKRGGTPRDVLIDLCGILIAGSFIILQTRLKSKRRLASTTE